MDSFKPVAKRLECDDDKARFDQACKSGKGQTGTKALKGLGLLWLAVALLSGCDSKRKEEKRELPAKAQAYFDPLPDDQLAAGKIIASRLSDALHTEGDILVIQDESINGAVLETYALPVSTSWEVSCGISGLSVAFGHGEGSDVPKVVLSMSPIMDKGKCAHYSMSIAGGLESLDRKKDP